jgi:HlyD family secretion protein
MTNRDRAVIRSPVSGVVLARQVEPGQTVAASFNTPTLFVIAEDLSAMQLRVQIDEADVGQVRRGQKATFTVDAIPGASFRPRSSASRWPRTTPPPRRSNSSRGSRATR